MITVSRSQSLPDIGIFHHETIGYREWPPSLPQSRPFFVWKKRRKEVCGSRSNGKKWCHHKV